MQLFKILWIKQIRYFETHCPYYAVAKDAIFRSVTGLDGHFGFFRQSIQIELALEGNVQAGV